LAHLKLPGGRNMQEGSGMASRWIERPAPNGVAPSRRGLLQGDRERRIEKGHLGTHRASYARVIRIPHFIQFCGEPTMSMVEEAPILRFEELTPGDRVAVEHRVTVGIKSWTARTAGRVLRTERRRHGLHFHRNVDDKVASDVILLERPDGELTTLTMDEFTTVHPA
jgi:hypothetical protein